MSPKIIAVRVACLKPRTLGQMTQYGIVVDLGSLGLRLQIYQWHLDNDDGPPHPPRITHESDWHIKISPGVLSFADSPGKVWSQHYQQLMEFAAARIPLAAHGDTPVFVLATAGMRLLPTDKRDKLTTTICSSLKQHTPFRVGECDDFVQVIDGETEGTYGWLALNYLMNRLDGTNNHTVGFMDMGGALTQVAFAPSDAAEVERHDDDIATVVLRNTDGLLAKWRVFVETWLGFGANVARETYLNQLVLALRPDAGTTTVYDACMPRGATTTHNGVSVAGVGNYDACMRTIYPLLNKHVPCKEEPCLFNGIHAPKLDFDRDKFVGVSEYWYTANDVFGLGGEYNYHVFNEKVKQYCESEWKDIVANYEAGGYNGLDPDKFLSKACFKALWVLSVLHEGFLLPRLGIDISEDDAGTADEAVTHEKVPLAFLLALDVDGDEISWTLGKMVLFASLQVPPASGDEPDVAAELAVGIYPASISGKRFIGGGGELVKGSLPSLTTSHISLIPLFVVVLIMGILWHRRPQTVKRVVSKGKRVADRLRRLFKTQLPYQQYESAAINLEEGLVPPHSSLPLVRSLPMLAPQLQFLRTRLTISLAEEILLPRVALAAFLLRPFPLRLFTSNNASKDDIHHD